MPEQAQEGAAPDDVRRLAEARAAAREARDWRTADELRGRIEAAGWRVVDEGLAFSLQPARPADAIADGVVLHGAPETVPSRLDEPDDDAPSVVIPVMVPGPEAASAVAAVRRHAPAGTTIVVVAAPGHALEDPGVDLVRTAQPWRPGAALQAGLRRATGRVVVVLEPDQAPSGDVVAPLVDALRDDRVAIAGSSGLVSLDLLRFDSAGTGDVTAVGPGCYAFRRQDALERGPFDEQLFLPESLAAWWSLVLRDEGPGATPRRALAIDLPIRAQIPEARDAQAEEAEDDDRRRQARRDRYRIADRFRGRHELAQPEDQPLRGIERPDADHEDDDAGERRGPGDPEQGAAALP